MASEEEKLKAIRVRIDQIDEEIQRLINERAGQAQEVARVKMEAGSEALFYRPEREAQVLRSVRDRNTGPLDAEEMARLFREIMSACLALEQPMKIAFLGPEGTYTQAAAQKHFGHSVITVPLAGVDEVFREVEADSCNYGVVPVENSTEGVVTHTLDRFLISSLLVCGEVELRIHHQLMSKAPSLQSITKVYSHQQSLGQCREWLDANLPTVERIAVSSNAEAAKRAAREDGAAAIASETAAQIYGLTILAASIEDEPENTTRFLIIGKQATTPSGEDKTTLLLSTRNEPGALYRLIKPFEVHNISMSRIESRPSRRAAWDYVFFVDINGHVNDAPVAEALQELKKETTLLKVLGSYPKAVL